MKFDEEFSFLVYVGVALTIITLSVIVAS